MLRLEGVCADIAGARVLRNISLAVPPGGRVALIGRNGAGKTTTLRALMGLAPVREGKISIDARIVAACPRTGDARSASGMRRRNATCSAVSPCAITCSCRRRFSGFRQGVPAAARSRLRLLPELRDLAARKAADLSGGQGKMVALGRAPMVGTRAILLDEPLQGLAPALALRYVDALRRLRSALPDVAILITESSPDLLKQFVDTTFVIERGETAAA
jgi:ABC-type branched-subunit amino acid transport system ATPase component